MKKYSITILRLQKRRFFKIVLFGIKIVSPTLASLRKIKIALELIQTADKTLFRKVLRIKHVVIFPGNDYYGCVLEKERTYIDQPRAIQDSSVAYLASSFVHEAWHIDQYLRGITEYGALAERGAYRVQRRFLAKTGTRSEIQWLDKQYRLQWWVSEKQSKTNNDGYDTESVERHDTEFRAFIKLYRAGKLRLTEIDLG